MKKCLVFGAGGFIGNHLINKLKREDSYVVGIDLKHPEYSKTAADSFFVQDLRNQEFFNSFHNINDVDEIYQLAADMGGAGYIFTGEHDADIMHNSSIINLNLLELLSKNSYKGKVFYSSSACIYPEHNQLTTDNPNCEESTAYPANPDSEYGWEKLFSERLYLTYSRNYGLNVRIARFHNIFGPMGAWNNGKEKSPAAICRKVGESKNGDTIEIWGDGNQTRTYLYIDECLEGIEKLMNSDFIGPVNIGSEEMISINDLAKMVMMIACKNLNIKNIQGPVGVRGRKSDNKLIFEKLNWKPSIPLKIGMEKTYKWIEEQIKKS